jgi:hypothetical protein
MWRRLRLTYGWLKRSAKRRAKRAVRFLLSPETLTNPVAAGAQPSEAHRHRPIDARPRQSAKALAGRFLRFLLSPETLAAPASAAVPDTTSSASVSGPTPGAVAAFRPTGTGPMPAVPAPLPRDRQRETSLRRLERYLGSAQPSSSGPPPPFGPYTAPLGGVQLELVALLEGECRAALRHAAASPPEMLRCAPVVRSLGFPEAVDFCRALAEFGLVDGRDPAFALDRERLLARMRGLGWLALRS